MKKTIGYSLVVLSIVAVTFLTGCMSKKGEFDENTNMKQAYTKKMDKDDIKNGKIKEDALMLSVGDIDVTYREAMAYALLYKKDYEGLLSDKIWDFEVETNKTFDIAMKECIINQIVKSKIIEYGAKKVGVVIEPDEKIEIEDKAMECYRQLFGDKEGMYGVTQAVIKNVLYDDYLANKVYEVATNDVDVVVKDSESKVPIVKQIEVLYKGYDANGKKITRSKALAKEILSEVKNKIKYENYNFTEMALEYSDSKEIELKMTADVTSNTLRKVAIKLEKDELSEIIETDKGYYLYYCVEENDEELEKNNIEDIIIKRQDEIFANVYEKWLTNNNIYIVSELWNKINLADI